MRPGFGSLGLASRRGTSNPFFSPEQLQFEPYARTNTGVRTGTARIAQHRGRPARLDVYASARDAATAAHQWELTEQARGRPLPV